MTEDKRSAIDWLSKRLKLQLDDYAGMFYRFEVNKTIKTDISNWCAPEGTLNYAAKWRVISELNGIMGMDANINAIDIYDLVNGDMLSAQRTGATIKSTGDQLSFWESCSSELQANFAVYRQGDELVICHQINRFETGAPLLLVVFHVKIAALEEILTDMRVTDAERILYNDEHLLINQSVGDSLPVAVAQANTRLADATIRSQMMFSPV